MSKQSKPNPALPPVKTPAVLVQTAPDVMPSETPRQAVGTTEDRVPACQRNHDAFYRPPCLSHLPALPLYLMVAHWGWCTGNALTAATVGEAFRMGSRRSQAVMRYFARYETDVSFVRPWRGAIRITALPPVVAGRHADAGRARVVAGRHADAGRARVARKGRIQDQQSLRRWFLQRPNGAPEA